MAESALSSRYADAPAATKRSLMVRDGLLLLILCSATVALFGITWFLFKSFESHREDLGKRWSERGRTALQQGRPAEASQALHIALAYEPGDRTDQLLLAQALAESGHIEAATNYFLNLWDVQPGDGFVNLQLARLARKRGEAQPAINYYRASIFGNWEGDGVARRREVRLELADYLAQRGQILAARSELLIAAGNAPEKEGALQIAIADRLQAIGDLPDALHFYQVAVAADPHNEFALERAGRAAYALGDYNEAYRLLGEALAVARRTPGGGNQEASLAALVEDAHRAPQLILSRDLPAEERADHIVTASEIAQKRLKACLLHFAPTAAGSAPTPDATVPPVLSALKSRWADESESLSRRDLERDSVMEDGITQLIDDTEVQTAKLCGAPTGDDALLLMLAARRHGGSQ